MLSRQCLLLSCAAIGIMGGVARAAELGVEPAADSAGAVTEVVVTAQKRVQKLTDVPMSISAYDSKALDRLNVRELDKIGAVTPGFVMQYQDPIAPGFAVRGVTSDDPQPYQEQRVAVFQDGVANGQMVASYGELFDLDRVEVEKGPQSTLHGRSALNGGVSIIQKRATPERAAAFKAGVGNWGYWLGEAVVNAPLSDNLSIRVGARVRKRNGFQKDALGGESYNAMSTQAYRGALHWTPSADLTIDVLANYEHNDPKGGVSFKSNTFLPRDPTTGATIGDLNFWTPLHLSTFGGLPPLGLDRKLGGLTGLVDWKISDKLSLSSVTGYRSFKADETFDPDGTSIDMIAGRQYSVGWQYSQELRLNFRDVGPLEGFLGVDAMKSSNKNVYAFAFDERAMALLFSGTLQKTAPNGLTNAQINGLLGPTASVLKAVHLETSNYYGDLTSYDLFGDVTWHVTPKLDLVGGARATFDDKSSGILGSLPKGASRLTGAAIFFPSTPGQAKRSEGDDFSSATWRAVAKYAVTPDVNLYASYGIGKRPEVIQPVPQAAFQRIPGETLKSVEGGVKGRFWGGRIIADASVFHYDYENFQTRGFVNGTLTTINAGKADATGFETQATANLTGDLSVFASYGYNHARLRSGAYAGNQFRNSPDHKVGLGGAWDVRLGQNTFTFAPVWTWQSKVFFSDDNDKAALQIRNPAAMSDTKVDEFQKGFGLLSGKIVWKRAGSPWSVELQGENLLDKKYISDAGNTGDSFGIPTIIVGKRRTVAVEIGLTF